ncbi:phage tail tape measure protein [Nocardia sp. CA-128927]|uniref:phage tail tape measure protein n=1 Tax=Nocardia sp. CA-128927 TaxID=3239975 RepID=UPI003D98FC53
MSDTALAYTTLQVIPSMRGTTGALEGEITNSLGAAGRSAGRAAGAGIARGLADATAEVQRASAALAAARDKEADANGKLRVAELKLEEVRRRGNATASQIAAAEEALARAQRAADTAATRRARAADELAQARARMANATDEAAESEQRFGDRVGGLTSRLGPATKQMLAMGVAAAGIGSAMDLANEAIGREKTTDVLAASRGASPKLAAEYGKTTGQLYAKGFGESFGAVSEAIGAVSSGFATLGSEGEASLETVTGRALNFAEVFGTEVPESVQTASQLVTNGLAKDSTQAFDLMTAAFQRVPVAMRDELPEILNEYGINFRALGFTGQQSFELLVNAAQQGKFVLDKTGDALKEFTIRGSDMSKTSVDAYTAIGLSATDMSNAIATGGPAAQDALQATARGLLGIEDPATRANTAIALFGTPVEDLSVDQIPAFLQALSGGSGAMAGFEGAADRMGATLADNTASKLEVLKRSIHGSLVEGLTKGAEWIENNKTAALVLAGALGTLGAALLAAKIAATGYAVAQGIMAAATGAGTAALAGNSIALGAYTIATGVIRGATMAWAAAQWLLNAALSPIGLVIIGVTVAVAALVAGLIWAWNNSETFRTVVTAAWEGIKAAALFVWDNVLKPFFSWWVGNLQKAGEIANWLWQNVIQPGFAAIAAAVSGAWSNFIKPALELFGAALSLVGEKAGQAKDWVVDRFGDLVAFVTGLPGKLRSAASGMWDGIKEAFRAAVNFIIRAWNGLEFKIPGFKVGPVGYDGFTLGLPDIPELAGGGVARGPGTGTSDSILARISNGEFIEPADKVTPATLPLLEAIRAGWVPSPELLHALLPGFAGGGLVEAQNWARGKAGAPYQYGGVGDPSWDCSGLQSDIYAILTGKPLGVRHFTTETDFSGLGFLPGLGGPSDYSIGVMRGGGGPNSHMAGTIGDLNAESSSEGVEVGPDAKGAADFPLKWHLPLSGDPGGLLNPGGGAGTPGTGGGTSAGLGSGTGAGGSSAAGTGGSASDPGGNTVRVWVSNWPDSIGMASPSSSTPSSASPATPGFEPGGGAADQFDQQGAIDTALGNAGKNFGKAGDAFARGQLSATPFGGAAEGIEKTVNNVNIIVKDVDEAISRWRREQQRQAMAAGSRF